MDNTLTPAQARRLPISLLADDAGRVFCPTCRDSLEPRDTGRGYCRRCQRTYHPLDILLHQGDSVSEAIERLRQAQQDAAQAVFIQEPLPNH